MRPLVLAAVGAGLLMLGAAEAPVAYRLTPVMDGAELRALEVEITLRGDADGVTRVRLPDRWAGTDKLYEQVSDFEAQGAKVSMASGERVIRYRPEGKGRASLQQLGLKPGVDARAEAACVRRILGG